jgi:hypothetical protein
LTHLEHPGNNACKIAKNNMKLTSKDGLAVLWVVGILFTLLFLIFGGGIALLATLFGTVAVVISAPVLLFSGKRQSAGRLLAAWGIYLTLYVSVSTVLAVVPYLQKPPAQRRIGDEVCADAGCFAVDKVEKAAAGSNMAYTLFWHLSSRDKEERHFPGKGLELYMFDDRGRVFRLPNGANQDPLDVQLPAGQSVRESITFTVPGDSQELFLTAKYRAYTFQSFLPGALSLVSVPPAPMIRIQ